MNVSVGVAQLLVGLLPRAAELLNDDAGRALADVGRLVHPAARLVADADGTLLLLRRHLQSDCVVLVVGSDVSRQTSHVAIQVSVAGTFG